MKKKAIYVILIVILVGVFGYAAYMLGDYYLEKLRSDKCTAQASQHVHVVERPNLDAPDNSKPDPDPEPEPEPEPEFEPAEKYLDLDVDFEALWKINKDIVAWIYCPGTPINYPVVQAEDNDYYLRRLLDGKTNTGGTLFLDYRCPSDFTGINNIIYGHNMKSGAMFGSLTRYRDPNYYKRHPYLFLATPAGQYRVELFAGCTIEAMDDIYEPNPTQQRVEKMMRQSSFIPLEETATEGPILTLSTCAYNYENARYVVLGRLVPLD